MKCDFCPKEEPRLHEIGLMWAAKVEREPVVPLATANTCSTCLPLLRIVKEDQLPTDYELAARPAENTGGDYTCGGCWQTPCKYPDKPDCVIKIINGPNVEFIDGHGPGCSCDECGNKKQEMIAQELKLHPTDDPPTEK